MTVAPLRRPAATGARPGTAEAAGRRRRRDAIWLAALLAAASLVAGTGAAVAPALTVAGVGGVLFLIVTGRDVASGIGVFTVLMFFDRATTVQVGGATPVKAAGALLALLWILVAIDRRRRAPLLARERPVVAAGAAAFVAWTLLSALWAEDPARAVSTAFRLAQGVMLLFILYTFVTRRSHVRVIVFAFVAGAIVAVVAGLFGKYSASSSVNDGRLSGGFDDPNELAAVLVPAMVFAAAWFLVSRRLHVRIALAAVAAVMGVVFLRTDSQAGLVALGVVLVAGVAFSGRARPRVAAAVMVFAGAAGFYYTFVTEPVALQTIASDNNTSNRKTLWAVAGQMVADRPVTGVGAGNFVVKAPSYALEDMNLRRADLVAEGEIVHNSYLEVTAELGVVGLIAFLGLIAASLAGSVRAARASARARDFELEMLARAVFVGTVGILVAYFFATNTYEKQLWLLLALGVALPSVARRESTPRAPSASRDGEAKRQLVGERAAPAAT